MADNQSKAGAGKDAAAKFDAAGNPVGTKYNSEGKGLPLDGGMKNMPQDASNSLQYNEDGSLFTAPPKEESDKTIANFKMEIAGAQVAVNNAENLVRSAEAMMAQFPEQKEMFEKNLETLQAMVNTHKETKAKHEKALYDFRMTLVPPVAREVVAELDKVNAEIARLMGRKTELEQKKKLYIVEDEKTAPKAGSAKTVAPTAETRTAEQEAAHKRLVEKHGSQSKAIVALAIGGEDGVSPMTNTEIYKLLGIPPASVPGPKNDFLKSAEGQKYEVHEGRFRLKA